MAPKNLAKDYLKVISWKKVPKGISPQAYVQKKQEISEQVNVTFINLMDEKLSELLYCSDIILIADENFYNNMIKVIANLYKHSNNPEAFARDKEIYCQLIENFIAEGGVNKLTIVEFTMLLLVVALLIVFSTTTIYIPIISIGMLVTIILVSLAYNYQDIKNPGDSFILAINNFSQQLMLFKPQSASDNYQQKPYEQPSYN